MPIRHPVAFPTGHVVTETEWIADHTLPNAGELAPILDPVYLRRDGTTPMLGNLDMDTHKIIFRHAVYGDTLIRHGGTASSSLVIRNSADTTYGHLIVARIYMYSDFFSIVQNVSFGARQALNSEMRWRAWDGAAWQICANLNNLVTGVPRFEIPRAGDFIHLTGAYHHTLPDTRPAAPNAGDIRYNAPANILEVWDGAAWQPR